MRTWLGGRLAAGHSQPTTGVEQYNVQLLLEKSSLKTPARFRDVISNFIYTKLRNREIII